MSIFPSLISNASPGTRGSAKADIVNVMSTGTVVLSLTRIKAANLKPGDDLRIVFNPTPNSFVLDKIEPPEPAVDQPS